MKGIVLTAMDDEIYEVLSDNEIFADLFNGALFGGNQIIRPDMLEQENEKKVMRVGKEGGRRVILRRIRDVQKLSGLRESCLAVVLAAEGQRNVHYAMPVRCMLYDAMDYTRQVERMVKKRREEGKLEKGAEYLSGMKREDRLLPVITIVFYYGEEQSWDGPLYLHDMAAPEEEFRSAMNRQMERFKDQNIAAALFGDLYLEELRKRREDNCRLQGIRAEFPLWGMDTRELLYEFIKQGFKSIVTCVDGSMLDETFVGRIIDESFIHDLPPNADICGENGEYHSFVFDGPIFSKPVDFEIGRKYYRDYPKDDDISKQNRYWYLELK